MANITTVDLIVKFQYAYDNKWGYIINKWHSLENAVWALWSLCQRLSEAQ